MAQNTLEPVKTSPQKSVKTFALKTSALLSHTSLVTVWHTKIRPAVKTKTPSPRRLAPRRLGHSASNHRLISQRDVRLEIRGRDTRGPYEVYLQEVYLQEVHHKTVQRAPITCDQNAPHWLVIVKHLADGRIDLMRDQPVTDIRYICCNEFKMIT